MKIFFYFYAVLLTFLFSLSSSGLQAQEFTVINHYGDTTGLGKEPSFYLSNFSQHTLLINYYEPVSENEIGELEKLIGNALNFYVNQLALIENDQIVISNKNKQILKELNEIVSDGIKYYNYKPLSSFSGFSERVKIKLNEIRTIDLSILKDSDDQLKYYTVQKELNDLKLLLNTEIGNFGNNNLLRITHSTNQVSNEDKDRILEELSAMELHDPMKTIEVELSPTTKAILTPIDDSSLFSKSTNDTDLIFEMLKANTKKLEELQLQISNMNKGSNDGMQNQIDELRLSIASLLQNGQTNIGSSLVPNLPDKIVLNFKSAGSNLNIGQQYILNELVEILAFNPKLRVVITGYADLSGKPVTNLELSKKRSKNVRNFMLDRGIDDNRMIMNYYGEKFSSSVSQEDRRVEVEFFVY